MTFNMTFTEQSETIAATFDNTVYVGGDISLQDKSVAPSSETQTVTADSGYDGLGTVTVSEVPAQTKSATPSTSAQVITPDSGY